MAAPQSQHQLLATIEELRAQVAAFQSERHEPSLAETRWRSLMQQSPFGIAIYRPDGTVKYGNPALNRLFELTPEETEQLLEEYNLLLDPRLAGTGVQELFREARDGRTKIFPTIAYEVDSPIRKRRVRRWLGGVIYPVRDSKGEVLEIVLIQADFTELKEAQQELSRSRDLVRRQLSELEHLYATAPVGLCVVDTELRYLRINHALAELNGVPREDHIGRTVREILPELADRVEPVFRRVMETGEPALNFEIHDTTRAAPELERDWLVNYYPVGTPDGAVQGVGTVVLEVTALKRAENALRESEERFREMAATISQAFWLFDWKAQRVIYASPAYEAIWGRSIQSLYGDYAEWGDSIHPDDRAFAAESFARIVETGGGELREYRILRPDGEVRWISDRGFAIRDDAGQVVRIAGIAEDITERKRDEETRRMLEAKVQHAQKLESLGVLAGGIAHDFNNLLAGILGNADLALLNLPPDSAGREFVDKIASAAKRASELTNQMLAYSGKGRFVVEPLDLNRLVEEMGHLLLTAISKKAILQFQLAGDLPAVEVDGSQVRQVVMNLITNASEALGDAVGTIRVNTGAVEADRATLSSCHFGETLPPGRYAYLEVSDTGCGMEPDTCERIFDPFFTTKFTGRGLGLAAVLGIVRGHQAAIRVDSEVGQGSTFRVLFPASDAAPRHSERARIETRKSMKGATILVVDDEPSVCEVSKSMLEHAGLRVKTARDGREGVEIFRRHKDEIAVVLLDMTMPHLDGEEAFRELRRIRPDVRVVLSSGYSEPDATDHFQGKGLAGFIQKPYTSAGLLDCIRHALR